MRRLLPVALAWCLLLAGCGGKTDGSPTTGSPAAAAPSRVKLDSAGGALVWGNGAYGVILLHDAGETADSWDPQARALASDRMTVLAPEDTSGVALRGSIEWLRSERQVPRVAVVASGDASRSVAELGRLDPRLIDQAILISSPGGLDWTAQFPKLFAASGDPTTAKAAEEAAAQAAGTWNVLLNVEGAATGQAIFASPAGSELESAILRRLDERR